MTRYVILVFGLAFFVELLLILGTNALLGFPAEYRGAVLAALVSASFAGGCLLPAFHFLGNGIWRILGLTLVILAAFGMDRNTARRGLVFLVLKFALQGAAVTLRQGGVITVVLGGGVVTILCAMGLKSGIPGAELIPVELNYQNKNWKLTALRDTGNTLRDPLTGERVLVAGADMGQKLLGLTARQLSAPAETLASGLAPGMRLIPYHTIGQRGAMMLALRFCDVKVGSWRGSALVAFAPECFGQNEGYQILIGGSVG